MEPKPFKSVDDQIAILQDRGMEICDDEFARRALREIGYYRLSGYSYPYRAVQAETGLLSDNFIEGTTIEKVVKLYRFDQELRAVTGLQLAKIEIVLRVMISHELGRVDPYIHLSPHKLGKKAWDKVNVRPTEQYSEWLDKYSLSVVRSNEDSVIHYKKKYDAILPVWVAVHVLDWGGLRLLYGFARDEQRKAIAQQLNISESQLSSWLHCLNEVRNVCAHHGRLYSRTFPKSPMLTGEDHELGFLRRFVLDDVKEGNRKEKKGKCFAQFTIIQYLLSKMNLEGINDLPHLLHKFPEVSPVSVKDLGVPENWEELPLWNGDMYSCPPQAMSYSQG
ncbi:Abi family protein [Actinomyces bouchesdurhonensis]|uniref:Abi family protein n=1 Tax=Actinomyces bouchesdurhonensis TaxID=1852361 RepID=UPI0028EB603C|nr:Abi family protein [Actinomyces bouchesdurhonensis]